jgi:hypothetical protein
METKKCTRCNQIKNIDEFSVRSDNGKPNGKCKVCVKEYYGKYNQNNKDKIKKVRKTHYENNKDRISKDKKSYYKENKEEILLGRKRYYEKNKEDIQVRNQKYYEENSEKLLEDKKIYYLENKEKILEYTLQYHKKRRKSDPSFALRNDLSTIVGRALKSNVGSKFGKSIMECLPYGVEELKEHLEKQFESWMTWDNHGKYSAQTWDDDDPSTWTWQLDHIIPHSTFIYTSMEDQEFKDCWALSNLRPLSAKKNQLDGATKTRHK